MNSSYGAQRSPVLLALVFVLADIANDTSKAVAFFGRDDICEQQ